MAAGAIKAVQTVPSSVAGQNRMFGAAQQTSQENLTEAIGVYKRAVTAFNVSGTLMEKELSSVAKSPPKSVNVSFGRGSASQGKAGRTIYSVRMEVNETDKVFALRVGEDFTELSLEMGGKLSEILRQEKGEVIYEQFI